MRFIAPVVFRMEKVSHERADDLQFSIHSVHFIMSENLTVPESLLFDFVPITHESLKFIVDIDILPPLGSNSFYEGKTDI